jgi:AcrR family transcriptional regulator
MPEAKTQKHSQILETARELFWKHGIKRVSVEEICRKAGVSKMTFYRYYPNKKEMAKEAVKAILNEAMEDYRALMARDISFAAKMEEMVRLKFEGVSDVSEELVNDIYLHADPDIKAVYETEAAKIMQEVVGTFVQAQEKGWIRRDIQPGFILYMLGAMREQYFDENLLKMYPTPAHLAVEMVKFFFYGLGVKKEVRGER